MDVDGLASCVANSSPEIEMRDVEKRQSWTCSSKGGRDVREKVVDAMLSTP